MGVLGQSTDKYQDTSCAFTAEFSPNDAKGDSSDCPGAQNRRVSLSANRTGKADLQRDRKAGKPAS